MADSKLKEPAGAVGGQIRVSGAATWCETCRDVHRADEPHVGALSDPAKQELLDEINRQHDAELTAFFGEPAGAVGGEVQADLDAWAQWQGKAVGGVPPPEPDVARLREQALAISALLAEVGIGPCTLPEGVRLLLIQRNELRDQLAAAPHCAPAEPESLDVDAMRANLLMTFGGGYRTPETIEAFRHGMETVCNVLAAKQKGEGTNGILPAAPRCAPQGDAVRQALLLGWEEMHGAGFNRSTKDPNNHFEARKEHCTHPWCIQIKNALPAAPVASASTRKEKEHEEKS